MVKIEREQSKLHISTKIFINILITKSFNREQFDRDKRILLESNHLLHWQKYCRGKCNCRNDFRMMTEQSTSFYSLKLRLSSLKFIWKSIDITFRKGSESAFVWYGLKDVYVYLCYLPDMKSENYVENSFNYIGWCAGISSALVLYKSVWLKSLLSLTFTKINSKIYGRIHKKIKLILSKI